MAEEELHDSSPARSLPIVIEWGTVIDVHKIIPPEMARRRLQLASQSVTHEILLPAACYFMYCEVITLRIGVANQRLLSRVDGISLAL